MNEKVSENRLFEGRFKCLDEAVRKIADKSNCIGHEKRLPVGQFDSPCRRIECGEELIFGED